MAPYITVAEIRAECIEVEDYPDDAYITARILIAQQFIDELTGLFFDARAAFVLEVNGRGHDMLWLPIPPVDKVAITEVKIKNEILDVADEILLATAYKYPLRTIPDDRFNPRLIRIGGIWPKGIVNIEITGEFGFVESDKATPPLIVHLCKMITIWSLPLLSDKSAGRADQIIEEQLGDYRYRLGEISKKGGFFNDKRIDNILAMYRRRTITTV